MNYWQLHIGDWVKGTGHLSPLDTGCYLRLLNHYYDKEMPLPLDKQQLHRITAARTKEERNATDLVLVEFFTLMDDGWYHARANAEIAKLQKKSRSAAAACAKGWERRRARADAMQALCDGNTNVIRPYNDGNTAAKHSKTPRLQAPVPDKDSSGGGHA